MGAITYRDLVATFGSAERAFDEAPGLKGRQAALTSADEAMARAGRVGARLLLPTDDDWPAALRDLPDPPHALFAVGDLAVARAPLVAIVGTRGATSYGERVAREIAGALARAGVGVISGLARGIDGCAHRAALERGGRTVAVLGTGVDIAYPAAHRTLHAQIGRRGLLLSEELPGERANGGSFPKRNRIIAALAQATIVVEAPARSGALITAAHALELGRQVAAVPGPIDAPHSVGSNELLRDGAIVIAAVTDALALVGAVPPVRSLPPLATPAERAVWTALAAGPADLDLLAARAALPARDCLAAVTALELAGAVECEMTGQVRRR
ncbi:MAG TPA: DNA-processing protein DprA [Gemmatimonadaceae bacterium]|nr:DNA-processing protein DprA [Gemmatimonadaceae bacterium]